MMMTMVMMMTVVMNISVDDDDDFHDRDGDDDDLRQFSPSRASLRLALCSSTRLAMRHIRK
jgi:hypothetical protein